MFYKYGIFAFGVGKLRFAYKYLLVNLQSCISLYKTASRSTIKCHKNYNAIYS